MHQPVNVKLGSGDWAEVRRGLLGRLATGLGLLLALDVFLRRAICRSVPLSIKIILSNERR